MRAKHTLGAFLLMFVVAALAWAQAAAEKPKPSGQSKPAAAGAQSKAAAGKFGTPADEAAVRALVEQYQQGFNSSDPAKAAQVYADSAVYVDDTGKVFDGKAEIAKGLAAESPSTRPRLALTVDAVRFIKPDVALMRGRSTVEGGNVPPGLGAGHWAVVAMKIAGQWKVVAAQAAANPPTQGRGR